MKKVGKNNSIIFEKSAKNHVFFKLLSTSTTLTRTHFVNFAEFRQKSPKFCEKLAQIRQFWRKKEQKINESLL